MFGVKIQPPGHTPRTVEFDVRSGNKHRPMVRQVMEKVGLHPSGLTPHIHGKKVRLDRTVEHGDVIVVTGKPSLFSGLRLHPELRDGEIWLTNIVPNRPLPLTTIVDGRIVEDRRRGWDCIGWSTKRQGQVAYDTHGDPITGMHPVFVQKAELDEAGITIKV